MKKTRIILLLFSAMQLAGINNISANTESGLHLTTSNLKCQVPFGRPDEAYDLLHFATVISVPPSSSTMSISSRWNKSLLMNSCSISMFCSRYEEDINLMRIVAA